MTDRMSIEEFKRLHGKGQAAIRKPHKKRYHEDNEQIALVEWFDHTYPQLRLCFFHVPNGSSLIDGPKEGAKRKKMGVRAGVSDLFLLVGRGGWFGLIIEFKASPPNDADVQDTQHEFIECVKHENYLAVVVRGWDFARELIEWYLALPETPKLPRKKRWILKNLFFQ